MDYVDRSYRFPIRILLGEKDGKIRSEFHYLPFSMNRLSLDGKIDLFFFLWNDNELQWRWERKRNRRVDFSWRSRFFVFSFFFFWKVERKEFHRKYPSKIHWWKFNRSFLHWILHRYENLRTDKFTISIVSCREQTFPVKIIVERTRIKIDFIDSFNTLETSSN